MCLWCGCVYDIFTSTWHTYTVNDIWNISVGIPWYSICINYDLEQRPINYTWQYTSVLIFYNFASYRMFYKYSACCCWHSITKPCLTPCDPCTAVHLTSLSLTITQSLPKFMSIESVMQSNHLLLCLPLFLLYIFVIFMYYTFFWTKIT